MRGLRLERHGGDENVIESRGRSAVGLKAFGKVFGQDFVLDPIEVVLILSMNFSRCRKMYKMI